MHMNQHLRLPCLLRRYRRLTIILFRFGTFLNLLMRLSAACRLFLHLQCCCKRCRAAAPQPQNHGKIFLYSLREETPSLRVLPKCRSDWTKHIQEYAVTLRQSNTIQNSALPSTPKETIQAEWQSCHSEKSKTKK